MIPEFPEFKKLELSDKKDVESFTEKFPPYSDFNFISMWSWDIEGKMRISQLNSNLVVRFTDYLTGEPFYSFIGTNRIEETIEMLLNFSKEEGLISKLKLVPEDSIMGANNKKFNINEERDHFDYILPVHLLKEYDSHETRSRGKAVRSLLREFSPVVELINLSEIGNQRKIFEFINGSIDGGKKIENEILAISRFVEGHRSSEFLIMGVFIDSKLTGFCFSEILKNKFANFHFWKASTKISKSMYAYLMQEQAKLLSALHNCEFLNIEQDLGIQGLRSWKMSFGKQIFLKKYTISLKD